MASNRESGAIESNKENTEKKDGVVGIEATDLATLLNRFEEATSSDDINLPRPINKTKWKIMKAKSAGNSPAVTPPATPPPSGPILLKTFTQARPTSIAGQTLPMRLTVVNPVPASAKSPSVPTLSMLPHHSLRKISASSPVPSQPKINIQISKSSLPSSVRFSSSSLLSNPVRVAPISPLVRSQSSGKSSTNSPSPSQTIQSDSLPTRQVITLPFQSKPSKDSVETTLVESAASDVSPATRTINILRMPALDAASSFNPPTPTTKQIIPKKRSYVLPNALEVSKKRKLDTIAINVPYTTTCAPVSLQQQSTAVSTPTATLSQQELSPLCLIPGELVSPDSAPSQKANNAVVDKAVNQGGQSGVSKTSRLQLQKEEHTYCWSGPCFNNKSVARVGISAHDSLPQSADIFDPSLQKELSQTKTSKEEVVLEEGEIFVDSNGNDIFSKEGSQRHISKDHPHYQTVEEEASSRVVCFETTEGPNRRGRKYRKRDDLRNSPVREDTSDFYDKIPSHYTALSIPSKQIRKTVFESVSSTLGSQDHLALSTEFEDKEEEDEGQYNKVPIHHRIFTNTSQDVELPQENEINISPSGSKDENQGRPSRVRRISSTSRHSAHSASSHRSGSRHSVGDRSSRSRSRSRSPAGSEYSQAGARRSRPLTRRRTSSSQLSVSSSSSGSSNSYCSTCGASLSRSRSRSFSSDGSRERSYSPQSSVSRSRSRSPRERGGRRRAMSFRSPSQENRGSRYRSRSPSPVRRRRNSYRTSSRSRRHQMKERSSEERRIMELRKQREEEKIRAMEERRVLYVGKLPDNYTKHQLRKRFECFGEIKGVRLNFRVHGDNYGFVTFTYACDAFAAKEKGNSRPDQPKFDLCFGGRRRFCPDKYADLDGNREIEEEYAPMQSSSKSTDELDYAALLKQHVSAQKKRKR